ncbi:putative c2h2 type zinc finger domain protein [Neofusicoccum parvum UCRNP2]|uniref:Putative c2h2 type zinc finger domain protein n=1 Tax=Botryosphaeria parva (strain UCR-NP2) TaxID=1287680 RepID=R1GVD8_BOTPV|nr:putative c2h2 type zinc finger domain protein [Neofusicoccum parvum UCRNP2]
MPATIARGNSSAGELSYATEGILLDASMLIPSNFSLDNHAWANFPDLGDIRRHIDAYWTVFHPNWLFLHKPSFRPEQEPPFLLLSMVMTSLWLSSDEASRIVAMDLNRRLMSMLYQQRGMLLHLILATHYAFPLASPTGCTASVPRNTHALLADLVRTARRLGTFSYPAMLRQFNDADLVFVTWVRVEEVKRFDLILFRLWGVFHESEWAPYKPY